MALPEGIEINPKVVLGKPVIRGTRIPVELILRKLGEGATEEDLLDAYPDLNYPCSPDEQGQPKCPHFARAARAWTA